MQNSSAQIQDVDSLFILGQQSRSVQLFTLTVSVLTIAVGLIGNLLLSLTIAISASLRTPMNTFVLSIGLVDLLTSVFLLPLRVFLERSILSDQEIDPAVYGIELFVRTFTDITRLFLMMSLSVERYQSIANPLSVSKVVAKRRAVVMSGVTWTVSIALSGISIRYFCDTVLHQPCLDSTNGLMTTWGNLEVFVEMPLTLLSILAIAVCYSLIVLILRQQRKKMAGHLKPKVNQVVPVDTSKAAKQQFQNGIKVEVLETKGNIIKTKSGQEQECKKQRVMNMAANGVCKADDNDVIKKELCLGHTQKDSVCVNNNNDSNMPKNVPEINQMMLDVREVKNENTATEDSTNNLVNTEINTNKIMLTANQTACVMNVESINNESYSYRNGEDTGVYNSSRSALNVNSNDSNELVDSDKSTSKDVNSSSLSYVVSVTRTTTSYADARSLSSVENKYPRVSLLDLEQLMRTETGYPSDSAINESTKQLLAPDSVCNQPLVENSVSTYKHGSVTTQSQRGVDNRGLPEVILNQASLSIQLPDGCNDTQCCMSKQQQRQYFQSSANVNKHKTSPRSKHLQSPKLQSIIAFLHSRESKHARKKLPNFSKFFKKHGTSNSDSRLILDPEDKFLNPNQVSVVNKPNELDTSQSKDSTLINSITLSSNGLTCPPENSFPEFAFRASTNTALQTSVEGGLDYSSERFMENRIKGSGSTTLSCESSVDNRCLDMSLDNNNPSVLEIPISDNQKILAQISMNNINPPLRQQVTEHSEINDSLSKSDTFIVDTTTTDISICLEANPHKTSDMETSLTDKSNDKVPEKQTNLQVTDSSKHIEVVEMDGTVHLQIVNTQSTAPIEGAVCLMNPRNKEQGKRRVELKAALKVGLIVCCFACLWMPLPVTVCILRGTSSWTDSWNVDMLAVFSAMATSTAAIDPILYGFLNPQIRSALQASLYRIRRKIMSYCKK